MGLVAVLLLIVLGPVVITAVVMHLQGSITANASALSSDRQRRARNDFELGEAPVTAFVRDGKLPSLAQQIETPLAADVVRAMLRSLLRQRNSSRQTSSLRWLSKYEISTDLIDLSADSFHVRTASQRHILYGFPVAITAAGAGSLIVVGPLAEAMFTQSEAAAISFGAKRIEHWQKYLTVLDDLALVLRDADARTTAHYVGGSPVLEIHRSSAPQARSNILPTGNNVCRRLNCDRRGVPSDAVRCVSCGHALVLVAEYKAALMSAPGVLYDADYVEPVVPVPSPLLERPAQSGTSSPTADTIHLGSRVCRRLNCGQRGVLTQGERCEPCEHITVPADEFRDQFLSAPGVPVLR